MNDFSRRNVHWNSRNAKVGQGFPDEQEGKEGDEQIRFISSLGLYLFKKYKNEWYGVAMSKMSALKKL